MPIMPEPDWSASVQLHCNKGSMSDMRAMENLYYSLFTNG